jgi:hypothetical protein
MRLADARDWPVSTRIAAACLAAALVIDLAVLLRARQVDPTPPLVIVPVMHITVRPPDDAELVREAANRAPFGGTPLAAATLASNAILEQSTVASPPTRPRLLGTVVEGGGHGGGFVVVELPDARVQLVRIGERAGDLRLRSVAAGEAVFDDPHDGRITLRTSPPGSGPGSRP